MYNFRTDLALERRDLFKKANNIENEINGIETEEDQNGENIKITRVKIINDEGANALQKPVGNYITIDLKNLKIATEDEIQKASESVTKELKVLIEKHIQRKDDILVVGLGNIYVTPDSLGPKVVSNIDITRHLFEYLPQYVDENTRPVSAIAPGVLGTTGIETLEILKGIVDNTKPKLLIVIDALSSRSIERISSTIQIADTGIVPGSGVNNKRKDLSKETLGIPVIAMGIPTVVEAATITADCLDLFSQKINEELQKNNTNYENNEQLKKMNEAIQNLMKEDKYELVKQVLVPENYNFIVTPKEIDDLIENMKDVIARGINFSIN